MECAPRQPPPAHFYPANLHRAAAVAQDRCALATASQKPENVIEPRRRRRKIAQYEPGAKAILLEPRSVKKANSYQLSFFMKKTISNLVWAVLIAVVALLLYFVVLSGAWR